MDSTLAGCPVFTTIPSTEKPGSPRARTRPVFADARAPYRITNGRFVRIGQDTAFRGPSFGVSETTATAELMIYGTCRGPCACPGVL